MNNENETINILTNPTSSPNEWLDTIAQALQADIFANTWSSSQGPANRIVFQFPDGLNITWSGAGDGTEPNLIQIWITNNGTWYPETPHNEEPIACPTPTLGQEPEWDPRSQLWTIEDITNPHEIATLITQTTYIHGTPTIILPWGNLEYSETEDSVRSYTQIPYEQPIPLNTILEYMNTDEYTEMLENFTDIENPENFTGPDATILTTYLLNEANALQAPEEWGTNITINFTDGDTALPPHSPYMKFMQLTDMINNLPNWVINWDECCGTCHGSTYRMLIENKNLPEGSPCFTIWGQNAQYDYQPNGYINHTTYTKNPEERNTLKQLAHTSGLHTSETQDSLIIY